MRVLSFALLSLALSGCSQIPWPSQAEAPAPPVPDTAAPAPAEPVAPPPGTGTAEDFDTTSEEERAAAASTGDAGGAALGSVVASLGDVTAPGFWLETPLVAEIRPGRVETAGGATARVELRPAAEGTGSRLSLAAMRVLGLPLTALAELTVYADG